MLRPVRARVIPKLTLEDGGFRIVDDTGCPKKGKHPVDFARQSGL
jgi:SRSO17 transposase